MDDSARVSERMLSLRKLAILAALALFAAAPAWAQDADADGILDGVDNCEFTQNALQEDRDLDGIGDACADADSDGLTDAVELFLGLHPDNPDTDSDFLIDGEEYHLLVFDPDLEDTFGFGLTDFEEMNLPGFPFDPAFAPSMNRLALATLATALFALGAWRTRSRGRT